MKTIIQILLLQILFLSSVKSQDSLIYYQKDSGFFTNKYVFYKNNRFKHTFATDDRQIWYGQGQYIKEKDKWILNFEDMPISELTQSNSVSITPTNPISDSVLIYISNFKGEFTNLFGGLWFKSQLDSNYRIILTENKYPYEKRFAQIPVSTFKGLTKIYIPKSPDFKDIYLNIKEEEISKGAIIIIKAEKESSKNIHYVKAKQEILMRKGDSFTMPDRYHTVPNGVIELIPNSY